MRQNEFSCGIICLPHIIHLQNFLHSKKQQQIFFFLLFNNIHLSSVELSWWYEMKIIIIIKTFCFWLPRRSDLNCVLFFSISCVKIDFLLWPLIFCTVSATFFSIEYWHVINYPTSALTSNCYTTVDLWIGTLIEILMRKVCGFCYEIFGAFFELPGSWVMTPTFWMMLCCWINFRYYNNFNMNILALKENLSRKGIEPAILQFSALTIELLSASQKLSRMPT